MEKSDLKVFKNKSKGIVNVWYKETVDWIKPETTVYVPRLYNDFVDGLYFDMAFTSKESLNKHCHWVFNDHEGDKVAIEKMPFKQYLKIHIEKVRPMNPFFALGRSEFLEAFRDKHGYEKPSEKTNDI